MELQEMVGASSELSPHQGQGIDPLAWHNQGLPTPPHPVHPLPSPQPFPTIFWALAVSLRKALDSRRARSWEKWRLSTRRLPEYTWLTVTSALYPAQDATDKVNQGGLRGRLLSSRGLLLSPRPTAQPPASGTSEAPSSSSSLSLSLCHPVCFSDREERGPWIRTQGLPVGS